MYCHENILFLLKKEVYLSTDTIEMRGDKISTSILFFFLLSICMHIFINCAIKIKKDDYFKP